VVPGVIPIPVIPGPVVPGSPAAQSARA
jgi:hypothetical protein